MSTEQDEAAAQAIETYRLQEGQALLDRIASREAVQAVTSVNNGVAQVQLARVALRVTLRRCAVFGCVLALGWSVYGWIMIH